MTHAGAENRGERDPILLFDGIDIESTVLHRLTGDSSGRVCHPKYPPNLTI